MNHFTKRYWLTLTAMALTTFATTNRLSAQVVINSPDDIVQPGDDLGDAYYDTATGNVYFALGAPGTVGSGLFIAGIANVDDQLIFANFDATAGLGPIGGTEIAFLALPGPFNPFGNGLASGIFNLGNVLPADPSITDIASFQTSPFGAAQFQFSSVDGSFGFRDFNVITAAAVPEPGSLSLLTLAGLAAICLLYTSPSPRDRTRSRMPSSA